MSNRKLLNFVTETYAQVLTQFTFLCWSARVITKIHHHQVIIYEHASLAMFSGILTKNIEKCEDYHEKDKIAFIEEK